MKSINDMLKQDFYVLSKDGKHKAGLGSKISFNQFSGTYEIIEINNTHLKLKYPNSTTRYLKYPTSINTEFELVEE